MIRDIISPNAFRQDQAAVVALRSFLDSPEGAKFSKALRGAHPLVTLTETQVQAKGIRDASIVEGSSPGITSNLLGKVEGYELCLKLIDDLLDDPIPLSEPFERQPARVAKVLRKA